MDGPGTKIIRFSAMGFEVTQPMQSESHQLVLGVNLQTGLCPVVEAHSGLLDGMR